MVSQAGTNECLQLKPENPRISVYTEEVLGWLSYLSV